jgi:molybdopterin-dependent oxidoreductase alpha subunit
MHAGKVRVFLGLGGNFLSAAPDTHYTAAAMRRCDLTVQIATKLNRGHLVTGKRALILPCLGRSERDQRATGEQFVTVENSMGVVQSSQGRLSPASPDLLSEVAIICGIARATLPKHARVPWADFSEDYSLIRQRIAAVLPDFNDFEQRVQKRGGFYLPNAVKSRVFNTHNGKAQLTLNPLSPIQLEAGELLLQTLRSHDQFNTTIYGENDRYRGIKGERRILFMHPEDMRERGIQAEDPLTIISQYQGTTRTAELFLAIPYATPRGCVAAYYPEANVLVPIESFAKDSGTPTSKSVVVRVEAYSQGKELR